MKKNNETENLEQAKSVFDTNEIERNQTNRSIWVKAFPFQLKRISVLTSPPPLGSALTLVTTVKFAIWLG